MVLDSLAGFCGPVRISGLKYFFVEILLTKLETQPMFPGTDAPMVRVVVTDTGMSSNMAKRRLQKYVDREVQSSLLRRLLLHWVLFMVANFVAITMWTRFVDTPTEPWSETFSLTWQRVFPFALVSIALAPVFIWDAVKLSNRFAGPIIRVRRALAQIADGHSPNQIEFRHGDFWKSLANDLNRAFNRLVSHDAKPVAERE